MSQNDYPLVSIVVPTYNQARYLPIALDSVMFQEYRNIEIIICNHGSTDNTSEVIKGFLENVTHERVSYLKYYDDKNKKFIREWEYRYPQNRIIKVFEGKENIGAPASYNIGFKNASGKYCMYLVADDYLMPNAIQEMVWILENKKVDVVYADMFVVDHNGRILQRLSKPDWSFQLCLANWYHLGVCRLYKKKLHDICGYYNEKYRNAHDYDMFLRFAMSGAKFFHIKKVLYCVRKHDPENPNEPAAWRDNGYENLLKESVECAIRARKFKKFNK
ncbi:hypothetical protein JCM13304A_21580 [Desulfothermus okinawensis JCM 13304]